MSFTELDGIKASLEKWRITVFYGGKVERDQLPVEFHKYSGYCGMCHFNYTVEDRHDCYQCKMSDGFYHGCNDKNHIYTKWENYAVKHKLEKDYSRIKLLYLSILVYLKILRIYVSYSIKN